MNFEQAGRAIWRHRWIVVGLTLLTVAASVLSAWLQPNTYETTATVRIQEVVPPGALPVTELDQRQVETYSQVLTGSTFSSILTQQLENELAGLTESEVESTISGEPVGETDLLAIVGRGSNPERVAEIVNGAPKALETYSEETEGNERIDVVDSAEIPVDTAGPPLSLLVAIAVVLGLIVSSGIVVALDFRRDRYADAEELERLTGVPVLASLPRYRPGGERAAVLRVDQEESPLEGEDRRSARAASTNEGTS